MANRFSFSNRTWEPLFFTSLIKNAESAEISPQKPRKPNRKKKEPACLCREDFDWDGEKDVWLRLANAVIIQAEIDWREATQRLEENPDDEEAKILLKNAEEFFLSEDYLMFTHYDGKTLLNRLKREQIQEFHKKTGQITIIKGTYHTESL